MNDDPKRCSKCKSLKAPHEFYTNRENKSGLSSWCRDCAKATHLRWWHERGGAEKHKAAKEARHHEHRRTELKRLYNLTPAAYDALVLKQGGLCAACGNPETVSKRGRPPSLCVDHDHTTGVVRGLLCNRCNQALGLLQDDPDRIRGLLSYVQSASSEGVA